MSTGPWRVLLLLAVVLVLLVIWAAVTVPQVPPSYPQVMRTESF